MPWLIEFLISICLLLGAMFALIGSIGLSRLPDFFMRLHGPTKSTTLGVGGMVLGSLLFFSTQGNGISVHEILITLFLLITAPVSANMLAKTAMHQDIARSEKTRGNPWKQ